MSGNKVVSLVRGATSATPRRENDPFDIEPDQSRSPSFSMSSSVTARSWVPCAGSWTRAGAWRPTQRLDRDRRQFAGEGGFLRRLGSTRRAAFYVVPGTVAETGKAKAADANNADGSGRLDAGDIVASSTTSSAISASRHCSSKWRPDAGWSRQAACLVALERRRGRDIALLCQLRGDIAVKVGGDAFDRPGRSPG